MSKNHLRKFAMQRLVSIIPQLSEAETMAQTIKKVLLTELLEEL